MLEMAARDVVTRKTDGALSAEVDDDLAALLFDRGDRADAAVLDEVATVGCA
jgi:hypothetical protein